MKNGHVTRYEFKVELLESLYDDDVMIIVSRKRKPNEAVVVTEEDAKKLVLNFFDDLFATIKN